ncbi:hypothetical protein DMN57_08125 [Escherichia coli]|nr:hypothetical protein [Escherichia coli]
MLANAISNNPDADIIIKQHPDAIKGGKSSYFNNDLIENIVRFHLIFTP